MDTYGTAADVGPRGAVLLLGYAGGVGRALLGLLEHTPPGVEASKRIERLLLLDAEACDVPCGLGRACVLPPQRITTGAQLSSLLRRYAVDQVVDVSGLGTLDCATVCDGLGVDLLTAGVYGWPNGQCPSLAQSMRELLREAPGLRRASHLLAAGMNPGVVNALAMRASARLATRAGVTIDEIERDRYALFVTEEDSTREAYGDLDGATFALTWSPAHALEELLERSAVFVRDGQMIETGRAPRATCYRVRCGDREIDGMLVPHEEVLTLGRRLPGIEIGFVYRLPAAARRALRAHPEWTAASDWRVRKLYPPHAHALEGGSDCVGVLLCTRRHGELWMGFDTDIAAGLQHGTNATELQVAAGMLAGLHQLGGRRGVHFVEDVDTSAYLAVVEAVLGPAQERYDAAAPPRSLAERDRRRSPSITGAVAQGSWDLRRAPLLRARAPRPRA